MDSSAEATGFVVEHRWKEEVIYWEGVEGFMFDGGWGTSPRKVYLPSSGMWDECVPGWLIGKRELVVARLVATGDEVFSTETGYLHCGASRILTRSLLDQPLTMCLRHP